MYVPGGIGGEEYHSAFQVARLAPPACGDAAEDCCLPLGIGANTGGHVGGEIAGGDGIYVNAF